MCVVQLIINTGDGKFSVQLIVLHPSIRIIKATLEDASIANVIEKVLDRIKHLGNSSSICASSSRLKSPVGATPGDAGVRSNMSLNARSTKSRDGHSK